MATENSSAPAQNQNPNRNDPNYRIPMKEFEENWGPLSHFDPSKLKEHELPEFIAQVAFVEEYREWALDLICEAFTKAGSGIGGRR